MISNGGIPIYVQFLKVETEEGKGWGLFFSSCFLGTTTLATAEGKYYFFGLTMEEALLQ